LPQKVTPALTVRAAANAIPFAQAAPTVRLKVPLRSMLSCLLLWLRHSSRQLSCPVSRLVQSSSLHSITFHSLTTTQVHSVWVIISATFNAYNHKLHSLPSQAHSTSFRFIPSSFTQQAPVHPLPLLCSPELSFGLRVVMLFAPLLVGRHTFLLLSTNLRANAKNHANPCSVRADLPVTFHRCQHFLIARTALIRSSFALHAHTLPPARGTHSTPFHSPLGGSQVRQRPAHFYRTVIPPNEVFPQWKRIED